MMNGLSVTIRYAYSDGGELESLALVIDQADRVLTVDSTALGSAFGVMAFDGELLTVHGVDRTVVYQKTGSRIRRDESAPEWSFRSVEREIVSFRKISDEPTPEYVWHPWDEPTPVPTHHCKTCTCAVA